MREGLWLSTLIRQAGKVQGGGETEVRDARVWGMVVYAGGALIKGIREGQCMGGSDIREGSIWGQVRYEWGMWVRVSANGRVRVSYGGSVSYYRIREGLRVT